LLGAIAVRSSIYKRFSEGGGFWEGGALELVKTDKEVGEGQRKEESFLRL
jgi:hypothetical protein